jgi:type IV pilus assembly protein PilO
VVCSSSLFKPGQEQVKDFYAELPITVKINGGYHDFGAFAADIAKLPRIVTLNNIAITPVKEGGSCRWMPQPNLPLP